MVAGDQPAGPGTTDSLATIERRELEHHHEKNGLKKREHHHF